jgi:hypothetical protein
MKAQHELFSLLVYITWILYFVIFLGVSTQAPQYLDKLNYYVKIYVSLFLIFRFNPFRKVEFNELDREIAFSAGIFLFATTTIHTFLVTLLKNYL